MNIILLCIALSLVTYLFYYSVLRKKWQKHANTPPCLPSLPIVGSIPFLGNVGLLQMTLTKKAQKYGPVFSLYFGSRYCVILNGYTVIREGLITNSVALAGRAKLALDGVVYMDPGYGILINQYDDDLRKRRHISLSVLRKLGYGNRSTAESIIQVEAEHLLKYISSRNGINDVTWCWRKYFEHVTLNVVYNLMLGQRFDYDDEVGQFLANCCEAIVECDSSLYTAFPFLLSLPHVKNYLKKYRNIYMNWMKFIETKVDENVDREDSEKNFITEYVAAVGRENVDKKDLAVIVRDLMIAGTETTSGQLNWALILLANHPEIQAKLQQEIDSVIPRGRLPSLDDKPKLPYLEATILEVMRIRTAVPLSMPHCTIDDVTIGGYFIPADTRVFVNLWSAHMDPDVWEDPEKFNPERFLNSSNNVIKRDLLITFSLGKRSCLGEVLARQEMFLFLSALIQHFNFLPPEGQDKVKDEMRFSTTLRAAPHSLRLVPRL